MPQRFMNRSTRTTKNTRRSSGNLISPTESFSVDPLPPTAARYDNGNGVEDYKENHADGNYPDYNDDDDDDDDDDDEYDDDPAPRTVRVVAPATLQAGYTFEAMVNDTSFVVLVPKGGVKEGQEFEVPYPKQNVDRSRNTNSNSNNNSNNNSNRRKSIQENLTSNTTSSSPSSNKDNVDRTADDEENAGAAALLLSDPFGVPKTSWRSPLCSCCDVFTQATFWMGCFCFPILLGQLLTRLKLTYKAQEGPPEETTMTFNRIVLTIVFVLAAGSMIPFVAYGINLMALCFFLYVAYRLRIYMRTKYDIPTTTICCRTAPAAATNTTAAVGAKRKRKCRACCTSPARPLCHPECEDACCILFCSCCSLIQMARHTHNDKEYPGSCCTTNGLDYNAPSIV